MSWIISAFYSSFFIIIKELFKHWHKLYFFQFRIAVVVTLLNEINIMSNILNSPFALLLCSLPHPPPPLPREKMHKLCFLFPLGVSVYNVFQALYQTSQTIKMNFEKHNCNPFQSPSRLSICALFSGEIQWICSSKYLFLRQIFAWWEMWKK